MAQTGSKRIALLFHNVDARWGSLLTQRPDHFTPGKETLYVVEWKRNLVAHGDARDEK